MEDGEVKVDLDSHLIEGNVPVDGLDMEVDIKPGPYGDRGGR
jgi:hypothetical protein